MSFQLSNSMLDQLVDFRHTIHRHPDLPGLEIGTANRVEAALTALTPDRLVTGLGAWQEPDGSQWGGTGIAALFEGEHPEDGPTLLFRCELDGLPISEQSEAAHRSAIDGQAHSCGHDGHMAIMLGLAMRLATNRPARGRVILLFQPAEETGKGALAVAKDPAFQALKPDMAFALHNLPGLGLGTVWLKDGAMCCASRGMRIALEGKTSHASLPQDGISPLDGVMRIVAGLKALSNGLDEGQQLDADFKLVTITHIEMGEACFGVSPARAEIWVTLRTVTDDAMAGLVEAAHSLATETAKAEGLALTISEDDVFDACTNAPETTQMVRQALEEEDIPHAHQPDPMRFSEDFGIFGQSHPATLFLLGAGKSHPQLHNPDYDFPDSLLSSGVQIFERIIRQTLG
ncbi:amidohydrolase [Cohaesibacter intestini]|uniref:amidohydrolase n=1 Tax=Cohaesibacter intestini TaxID=2211145 RepID=UPI000DEB0714|nr:amidohydrolase [Cohaesibacter intestini]